MVYTGWEQSATVTSAGRFSKQATMNGLATINETKQTTANTVDSITAYYNPPDKDTETFKIWDKTFNLKLSERLKPTEKDIERVKKER